MYGPIQKTLVYRLVKELPEDPHIWTMLAKHLLAQSECERADDTKGHVMKALVKAHRLDPDAAPYAFNAATVCRQRGWADLEAQYLEAALAGDSLSGAELVVGNMRDPFWNRWLWAVAERKPTLLNMLKAEAHIRLATSLALYGEARLAEHHLEQARERDPENHTGIQLEAEILWTTGRQAEAAETLRRHLPDLPFDQTARKRLREMLESLGRTDEAEALAEEARQMAAVCVVHPPPSP